jgi:2-polyprenyl-6-methoxyphenol hydroxylase-like FAD-dependent oxidoreductase
MSKIRNVLIAGGGVGGLAAAISFASRGVDVSLIEKREDFSIPGVGLGQPSNALRIYEKFGVFEEILDVGYVFNTLGFYDPQRNLIAEHTFQLGDERIPAFCALKRTDLHRILLHAAKKAGAKVRLGLWIEKWLDNNDEQVIVELSDGQQETYDLIAGFDGIRSTTRHYLYGNAFNPRHCGYGAWRIQIPRPNYVKGLEIIQGVCGKSGGMPITKDTMYLFNIRPEPVDAFYNREEMPVLLKERLAQYGAYVAETRESLSATSDIVYSPLEPLLVPGPWHRDRVVMGGDAAHVVPPHLTQGAAQAVEDAYVLAREMDDTSVPVATRLQRYSEKRYARAAFVYSFARQWLDEEQWVQTPALLEAARRDLAENVSNRIAVSDRVLDAFVL